MTPLILDASVFIAAAEPTDAFHAWSAALLTHLVSRGIAVTVPAFALVEISCALARRLKDPVTARKLSISILSALRASEIAMDSSFLAQATLTGTRDGLRGADALYAAAAEVSGGTLISWDAGHRSRAAALTPEEWLAANP